MPTCLSLRPCAVAEQDEFELGQQLQETQQELQQQVSQLEQQRQAAAKLQEQLTSVTANYRKADEDLTRSVLSLSGQQCAPVESDCHSPTFAVSVTLLYILNN